MCQCMRAHSAHTQIVHTLFTGNIKNKYWYQLLAIINCMAFRKLSLENGNSKLFMCLEISHVAQSLRFSTSQHFSESAGRAI